MTPPTGMALVSGKLMNPDGTAATNCKVKFELVYCGGNIGRVPSTGTIISPEPFFVEPADDGTWSVTVYGNDVIVCGSDNTGPSRWRITYVFNGAELPSTDYQINSGADPFSPDSAVLCSPDDPGVTDINCAVQYPYVTPPPPPIGGPPGPQGPQGPPGPNSLFTDGFRTMLWIAGANGTVGNFIILGDSLYVQDNGGVDAYPPPTPTSNQAYTLTGNRTWRSGGQYIYGGRDWTIEAVVTVGGSSANNPGIYVGATDNTVPYNWYSGALPSGGNYALFYSMGGDWFAQTLLNGGHAEGADTEISSLGRHTLKISGTATAVQFFIDGVLVLEVDAPYAPSPTALYYTVLNSGASGGGQTMTTEYVYTTIQDY